MAQFPRVHLNGTDGKVLLSEYLVAYHAVSAALNAVKEITVHGRDYYTIGAGADQIAYGEHRQRIAALEKIENDLLAIIGNIDNQINR